MIRIDAHQHFWRYDAQAYAWISAEMGVLRNDFTPNAFAAELKQHDFAGSVVVQARQDLDETRWLLELAAQHEQVLGVVGWVDLCSEQAAAQLDEFAQQPAFVGVRHVVQDEPDDEFMLRADFQRGIALLAERNLTYDILVYPRQLPAASALVEAFPRQRFVLDHIAKPLIKDQVMEPWADQLRTLASFPNVACKVSGMVTEADWNLARTTDFERYLDVVFSAFGAERLMFGSDWPVCLLAAPYARVLEIVETYAARLTEHERAQLFGLNAAEFYGLKLST